MIASKVLLIVSAINTIVLTAFAYHTHSTVLAWVAGLSLGMCVMLATDIYEKEYMK